VHSLAGQGVLEGASDLLLRLLLAELFHVPGDVLEDWDEGADVDVACLRDEEVPELGDRSLVRAVVIGRFCVSVARGHRPCLD
jgi:hypothetical protein